MFQNLEMVSVFENFYQSNTYHKLLWHFGIVYRYALAELNPNNSKQWLKFKGLPFFLCHFDFKKRGVFYSKNRKSNYVFVFSTLIIFHWIPLSSVIEDTAGPDKAQNNNPRTEICLQLVDAIGTYICE